MPTEMGVPGGEETACRRIEEIPARRWTAFELIFFKAMASSLRPGLIAGDMDIVPERGDEYVEKREKRIIVTTVGWSLVNGPNTGTDMP